MKKELEFEGSFYFLENETLYEAATLRKVNQDNYLYISSYGLKSYNLLIIKTSLFYVLKDAINLVKTEEFLKTKSTTYYRTVGTGDKDGNEIYVFYQNFDGQPTLMGRSFLEITGNVYRIGKIAYQFYQDSLHELCQCQKFEFYFKRLEIHTGEPDYSDLLVFEKKGGIWIQTYHWRPGSIKPLSCKQ